MPYANNQGIRIYYEVEGSGPALVLAHGLGGSHEDWLDMGWVEALGDRFQLIMVDARGHGRSLLFSLTTAINLFSFFLGGLLGFFLCLHRLDYCG